MFKFLLITILLHAFSSHANPECWALKGEVISRVTPALRAMQLSEEAFRACERGTPTYLLRDRLERIVERQGVSLPPAPTITTCQYNGPVLTCYSN